ncbi:MAG TPA: hypothetical protein VJN71_01435 [Nitrososphaerales archaeon]|nr:hypothetical protein [Nitrososphaerales archaeon]
MYKISKIIFIATGIILIVYGSSILTSLFSVGTSAQVSLIGIFPIYVGGMLLIVAAAMKEDWFTNARRYW